MQQRKDLTKIIWAVDAYAETAIQKKMATALSALTKGKNTSIIPTYILTPAQVNVAPELYPQWASTYKDSAERMMASLTKEFPITGLQQPRIVVDEVRSMRKTVDLLIETAKREKADLIAVSTHAKSLADRLLLGTFAETLLLHSDIPVYATSPSTESPQEIKNILFATDFSENAKEGFDAILSYAKTINASVTLFHKIVHPTTDAATATGFFDVMETQREQARAKADEWAGYASKAGIATTVLVDERLGSIGKTICEVAKEHGDSMIALVGQTGAFASYVVGSTARNVVRHAPCPVWVLHARK